MSYSDGEFIHAKEWPDCEDLYPHLGRPKTLILGLFKVYQEKEVWWIKDDYKFLAFHPIEGWRLFSSSWIQDDPMTHFD